MFIKTIDYHPNAEQYFSKLAHLPWSVCLDSCQPHINSSRFDILSAAPETTVVFDETTQSLHALSKKIAQLKSNNRTLSQEHPHNLPFYGGAIGFISYDYARVLEQLPNIAKQDIDLPYFVFGIYSWAIISDHQRQQSFFVCCLTDNLASEKYHWLMTLLHAPSKKTRNFKLTTSFKSNLTFEQYQQKLSKIANHIYEGESYQVNFAQRFHAQFTGDSYPAYQYLCEHNPAPFSAYLHTPYADILSCSPERFIHMHNKKIETKPIKGTRPRGQTITEDKLYAEQLIASEKDQAENLMIVDLMRNDLSKICKTFSVKVPKLCELESFANVHHLVSTIHGELAHGLNAIDVLQATFPGGSITGTPKVRAMQIIDELEPHRRNIYCGSILYIDIFGNMDSNIAIRTLLCKNNDIFVYGGGGIVADSDIEQEYQESIDKVKNIIDLLRDL